jgi:hypothetical protein
MVAARCRARHAARAGHRRVPSGHSRQPRRIGRHIAGRAAAGRDLCAFRAAAGLWADSSEGGVDSRGAVSGAAPGERASVRSRSSVCELDDPRPRGQSVSRPGIRLRPCRTAPGLLQPRRIHPAAQSARSGARLPPTRRGVELPPGVLQHRLRKSLSGRILLRRVGAAARNGGGPLYKTPDECKLFNG